jgi:DNA polymerase V
MDKHRNRVYIAIDLKSFYASVECVDRKLDPLNTNLVVADVSRTEKTICLAVSPSLKAYGIPGRPRLFEVVQKVREINRERLQQAAGGRFMGKTFLAEKLNENKNLALDYIIAPPRMARYIQVSSQVYGVYLKYIAPQDIHVYSIDEVFMDITGYGQIYGLGSRELARKIVEDVLTTTGITATVGIGTNMYLCKIAMDIMAKHKAPDAQGVRMAELDELSYRKALWGHQPITDFWRVGRGYAQKLARYGLYTMGDVARCSLGRPNKDYYNEDLLYKLFGINAELLIDHAWGWEPCRIADVHNYRPANQSMSSGQVLHCPYSYEKTQLVVKEMTDLLTLDLIAKGLATNQLTLTIGYDKASLSNPHIREKYQGDVTVDGYGRLIPKHAHGTINLGRHTASSKIIVAGVMVLFGKIVNPRLLVRRINITANNLQNPETLIRQPEEINLFAEEEHREKQRCRNVTVEREYKLQQAVVGIQHKYGKNSVLKGMNLEEGATTRDRNKQIGGHKA